MNIIRLKDDRIEFVNNREEFIELVEQEMGEESANYIRYYDEDMCDWEMAYLNEKEEREEFESKNQHLEIENDKLKNRIAELESEQNISVERIVSHRIFKVIEQVNKLTSMSKSQKIADQKQLIVEMLKEIVDNGNVK